MRIDKIGWSIILMNVASAALNLFLAANGNRPAFSLAIVLANFVVIGIYVWMLVWTALGKAPDLAEKE